MRKLDENMTLGTRQVCSPIQTQARISLGDSQSRSGPHSNVLGRLGHELTQQQQQQQQLACNMQISNVNSSPSLNGAPLMSSLYHLSVGAP